MEIKAVSDRFQNFVWSQFRGLYVTLASMWALGSEPFGLKLCRAFLWLYINEKQPGYDILRPKFWINITLHLILVKKNRIFTCTGNICILFVFYIF
jgi:hypothetical protein